MPRRFRRVGAGDVRTQGAAVPPAPFVELLRPAAGRGLVLEGVGGMRVRLTLRDGGRWRPAGVCRSFCDSSSLSFAYEPR